MHSPGVTFKEGQRSNDAAVVMTCLLVLVQVCVSFFLLFLIYRSKRLRVHLLVANAVAGGLVFALLVRPGAIRMALQFLPVTKPYCVMYHFAHQVEVFVLPWTLFMFTVDRLMYIRDPTVYAQKDSRKALIAMLVVPWAISVCFAIIDTALTRDMHIQSQDINDTYHGCGKDVLEIAHSYAINIYVILFCQTIPTLISFVVAIVSLSMWCCFKKRQTVGNVYDMVNDEVSRAVRDSVIAVSILNGLFFLYFLTFLLIIALVYPPHWATYHVLYFVFPLVECVVWVATLPELRNEVRAFCCRRNAADESRVQYANQTVDIDNVSPESEMQLKQ